MQGHEAAREAGHGGAQLDGQEDLDVGCQAEELPERCVVGVEAERSFDPVRAVWWRGLVRAGSPSLDPAADEGELEGRGCEADPDSTKRSPWAVEAGWGREVALLEGAEELEAAAGAACRVDRYP